MTVEIQLAQNSESDKWDAIISESPHSTLFHEWNWLKIAEKYTNTKLYPLIGIKNGFPVGVLPLFFQKRGPVRMVFSPPPQAALFYLGPILVGYNKLKQEKREFNYIEFQKSVETFINNELNAHYISIALPPNLQDPRPFTWSGYSIELHYDYVIDLSHGCDYLLQTLNKKQRQNLNRAKKRGMIIELGGKNEYEKILDLMEIRYSQQGKNITISRHYFSDIFETYKDSLKIFVAKLDDQIISGSIDFQYRDTHYSWIGNPKPMIHISPSPNDLLIWESVRFASEQGFRYYITMNAAGDKRLHTYFASKFDPELSVHFSMKKNPFIIGLFEKGYSQLIKPLMGKMEKLGRSIDD